MSRSAKYTLGIELNTKKQKFLVSVAHIRSNKGTFEHILAIQIKQGSQLTETACPIILAYNDKFVFTH